MSIIPAAPKIEEDQKMSIIPATPKIKKHKKPSKKEKIEDVPFLLIEKGNYYKHIYLKKSDFTFHPYNPDFHVLVVKKDF
jgi:hypothetical protein